MCLFDMNAGGDNPEQIAVVRLSLPCFFFFSFFVNN